MDNKENYINYRKTVSSFKKDAKIKDCFHFDKSACSNDIIKAHSIQENGALSLIEDEINGNLKVYSFLNIKYNNQGIAIGFEPIGKKTASTFSGFCGYHDLNLFSEIENNPIDFNNDKHCFLLSYRAFAKEYHSKNETLQGFNKNEFYQETVEKQITNDLIDGSSLASRDSEIVKNRLNEILKNEDFSELEYLTYSLDYMIPISLASSFNPEYSYSNKLLNKSEDPNIFYEFVNFVILPSSDGKTNILFSCLPEHKKSITFLDELDNLTDYKLRRAISSIMIAYVENTFFSPKLYHKLKPKEKKQLLLELEITNPMLRNSINGFFHSNLDLLNEKYKINAT